MELNLRRSDWVARWSEQLFAVGFHANAQAYDTVARLQSMLEKSPSEITPGVMLAQTISCGVGTFVKGASVRDLRAAAAGALSKAQAASKRGNPLDRIVISELATAIDPELQRLLE